MNNLLEIKNMNKDFSQIELYIKYQKKSIMIMKNIYMK